MILKSVINIFLFWGCISILNAQPVIKNFNTAIGKTVEFNKISEIDVFKNFKEYDNALITESKEEKNGFVKISDGDRTLILFTKYSSSGYKILAILDIGKIQKNTRVLLSDLSECKVNSKTDGYIVVLANAKPWKEYFTDVIKAWKIDQKTNIFFSIPAKGIECLNIEFGH